MATATRHDVTPEAFLRRVKSLYGSVRTDIREALETAGNKPENLPPSLWEEIDAKQRRVLSLLLIGFGIASMNRWYEWSAEETPLEIPYDRARRNFEKLANRRSGWSSRKIVGTTKRLLKQRMQEFQPGDSLRTAIRDVLPEHRVVTAVRTEMQKADSLGADAIRVSDGGRQLYAYLELGPCEHCQVCPLFHRVDIDFVRYFFPQATPVHPNCCCGLNLAYGTKRKLIADGVLVRNPSRRSIIRAMNNQGFKLPAAWNRRKAKT